MANKINKIDVDSLEMTMDIMKYVLGRLSDKTETLGHPMSEADLKAKVGETITEDGITGEKAFQLFKDVLVKAVVAEDHPRNLAFVPASPSKASVMFDLVTAASSIQGAYWMMGAGGIFCEMEAMRWLVSLTGLPDTAFGVFTSGGTAANLSALVAARENWREKDPKNAHKKGLMLTSKGTHSSVAQMARVIDADVIYVPNDENDKFTGANLKKAIENLSAEDQSRIFGVVATSGTTNAGIIDDLDGIGDVTNEYDIWFHVDGAYGASALAAPSVRHLFNGIEKADSITIDPHKWLFTTYDCGAIIYRDIEKAKDAHTQKGSYLEIFNSEAGRGFNPTEYQIQLTRRTRGMPLWFSLAMHGTKVYSDAIEAGITLANETRKLVDESEHLEMVRDQSLSIVVFRRLGWTEEQYKEWTFKTHQAGMALVAPTYWTTNGERECVYRLCFINPDTTMDDVKMIFDSMK